MTEQRAARLITMLASGAVAVADIFLLVEFARQAPNLPDGWKPYWYIPAGIVLVFVFAIGRFLHHLTLFQQDE